MLRLNWKDLSYLRSLVSKDHSDRSDYVLEQIDKQLRLVPMSLVPIAARHKNDIFLLSNGECQALIDKFSKQPSASNKTMCVWCPSEDTRDFMWHYAAEGYNLYELSKAQKTVTLPNGFKVYFLAPPSGDAGVRGRHYDVLVVLDPEAR